MLEGKKDNSTKVYLLLLDAADPDIIEYLIEKGQLPNFKRLREEGVYSDLVSFTVQNGKYEHILSPPVIATIFTGKSPEEHGMTSHIFTPGGPDYYYPFRYMPVPSLWNIVNHYDKTAGIVGTQGNLPVEDIFGFIVSGEYTIKKTALEHNNLFRNLFLNYKFPNFQIIFPKFLKKEIDKNFPTGESGLNEFKRYNFENDFPYETENFYIQHYDKVIKENPKKLELKFASEIGKSDKTAYYAFIDDYNRMKLSNYFYEKYKPHLFIEYLAGLDYYGNLYLTFEHTNYSDMNSILFNYYKFHDKHIGEVLDNIDDNTILLVLSDHGGLKQQSKENYTFLNMRGIKGILFLYGKDVRKNAILANVSVYDIAPTVLYLIGLPVGGMEGKVLTKAID